MRGPPNTNICQVWLHYAQWLQRRSLKCEMFTDDAIDDGQQVMTIHNILEEG
jgi:hypothetical protein